MASTTTNTNGNNDNRVNGTSETSQAYHAILSKILSHPHVWFSSPTSPHPLIVSQSKKGSSGSSSELPTISSLSLHPTLESALHVLNADLPSAHFLLRHAQSDPANEMMFLHGILHRVETDITNTRAWYAKIEDTDVFRHVWGSDEEGWKGFLGRLERWRDSVASRKGSKGKMNVNGNGGGMDDWKKEEEELRKLSLWEIMEVVKYCERKFGVERVDDATDCWVKNDAQIGDKANAMLVGGEGWREF